MKIGKKIREARLLRGWSQTVLAERSGLKPSAISHFETGQRKPSVENLCRLCDALDCFADFLLDRSKQSDRLHAIVHAAEQLFEGRVSPIHKPPSAEKWVRLGALLDNVELPEFLSVP